MPTFESLPRELRQQIFTLAFEDAIKADLRFNHNTRECIYRAHKRYTNSRLEQYHLLPYGLEESLAIENGFAPFISKTAETLCVVYPDVVDDLEYVLEKALGELDKDWKKEVVEQYRELDTDEAMMAYAYRARQRGHLADDCGLDNLRWYQRAGETKLAGWMNRFGNRRGASGFRSAGSAMERSSAR